MVVCHSKPRFSFRLAPPNRPLCSRDGIGVPDTVLGHVGPKKALGRTAGCSETSDGPQISLGGGLGDAAGDALRSKILPEKL
jgi:hypothetical protein